MKKYVSCMLTVSTSLSSAVQLNFRLVRLTFKVWSIRLSKKVYGICAANKNSRNKQAGVDGVEVMMSHTRVSWQGAERSCLASFIPPEDSSLSMLSHLSSTSFPTSRILLLPLRILNSPPFSPFHPPLTHFTTGSFSESLQLKEHCAITKNTCTYCCSFL